MTSQQTDNKPDTTEEKHHNEKDEIKHIQNSDQNIVEQNHDIANLLNTTRKTDQISAELESKAPQDIYPLW